MTVYEIHNLPGQENVEDPIIQYRVRSDETTIMLGVERRSRVERVIHQQMELLTEAVRMDGVHTACEN